MSTVKNLSDGQKNGIISVMNTSDLSMMVVDYHDSELVDFNMEGTEPNLQPLNFDSLHHTVKKLLIEIAPECLQYFTVYDRRLLFEALDVEYPLNDLSFDIEYVDLMKAICVASEGFTTPTIYNIVEYMHENYDNDMFEDNDMFDDVEVLCRLTGNNKADGNLPITHTIGVLGRLHAYVIKNICVSVDQIDRIIGNFINPVTISGKEMALIFDIDFSEVNERLNVDVHNKIVMRLAKTYGMQQVLLYFKYANPNDTLSHALTRTKLLVK